MLTLKKIPDSQKILTNPYVKKSRSAGMRLRNVKVEKIRELGKLPFTGRKKVN